MNLVYYFYYQLDVGYSFHLYYKFPCVFNKRYKCIYSNGSAIFYQNMKCKNQAKGSMQKIKVVLSISMSEYTMDLLKYMLSWLFNMIDILGIKLYCICLLIYLPSLIFWVIFEEYSILFISVILYQVYFPSHSRY